MIMQHQEQLGAFADACRRAASEGLVRASSGNLSWRLDKEVMAITTSGAWLERMDASHVALCRISDGTVLNDRRPSIESQFHRGVLAVRSDVDVVLHCQSPCATAVACGRPESINFDVLMEMPFYVGDPGIVEFLLPGSTELAEAVIAASHNHKLILLRNHGQVVLGADFDDTIRRALMFELASHVLLHAPDAQPIPAEYVAAIRRLASQGEGA